MSSKEYQRAYRKKHPAMQLVASAKFRAKRDGIPFDIEKSDIVIPSHCPIFGIPLVFKEGKGPSDNSPTLDRVHPNKGYVKDNVRVISHRANHKKQNNTVEDLELLLRYMKGEL
jgi:hypothetical protein